MTGQTSLRTAPVKLKSWRATEFGGLDLLHGHFTTHVFGRHSHETYSIGLLTQGGMSFDCEGESYLQRPGLIGLINPEQPHTGQAESRQGWTYRNLYPPTSLMMTAFQEPGQESHPVVLPAVIEDLPLQQRLIQAHQAFETPESSLTRESILLSALTALVTRHGKSAPPLLRLGKAPQAIEQVRQKLEDELNANPSLDELAALSGLGRFTLLRAFRQTFGLPPHSYQVQVRLRQAKKLLQAGHSLSETAFQVGFADQSHFGRHFKRTFGLTPARYVQGLSITF